MTREVSYIEVTLNHDSESTQAHAALRVGDRKFRGYGRARRNPVDADVPRIGDELAISRMLSDLSQQLLHAAAEAIQASDGHPVILR